MESPASSTGAAFGEEESPVTPSHRDGRRAAIDVGTNSIRCIVAEVTETGGFRVLDDEKATVRLGENLLESGVSSPAALERATFRWKPTGAGKGDLFERAFGLALTIKKA